MVGGAWHLAFAYGNHREQDVASSGSFKGSDGRVDERVDRGGGEDEACRQEADNLCESASACAPWWLPCGLPRTATWYVRSAFEATVTVTPTMQKNMKTKVHHAKFGKPP